MGSNLFGQEEWARRGEESGRIAALEARLVVAEAKLALINTGAWTVWTPQLDNATLGNGTLTARYSRSGRDVTVSFAWTFGSSSDISSWFSISNFPVAAQATGGTGAVFMNDSNTGNRAVGVISLSGTTGTIFTTIGGNGHVNNTYPWDWATGDFIQFTIVYEAAS